MLRQINNLRHFGRIRTASETRRSRKPRILKQVPNLEFVDYLELAVAYLNKPDKDLFFVQIGAFDGRAGDPLYRKILDRHWRGLLVEPQTGAFEQLQENYAAAQSTLQFYNVAIGPENGELTFYTRRDGDVSIASTQRHLLVKPNQRADAVRECKVPCWTMERLLQEANHDGPIDLLQIDAEGFDYQIIRSLDFQTIKPSIIRYEHVILSQGDRNACIELLAEQGYQIILEDRDTIALLPRENAAIRNAA